MKPNYYFIISNAARNDIKHVINLGFTAMYICFNIVSDEDIKPGDIVIGKTGIIKTTLSTNIKLLQKRHNVKKLIASNQHYVKNLVPTISDYVINQFLINFYKAPNDKIFEHYKVYLKYNKYNKIIVKNNVISAYIN